MKKNLLIILLCMLLALAGCSEKTPELSPEEAQQQAAQSFLEMLQKTDTYTLPCYAATFCNADPEPLVYYVFGAADDVTFVDESFTTGVVEIDSTSWQSEQHPDLYLYSEEYGELYFTRGDIFQEYKAERSAEDVGADVLDVLAQHGLKCDNLTYGGSAVGTFEGAGETNYYFALNPIGDIPVSPYTSGVYVMTDGADIIGMSYINIEDNRTELGEVTTLSIGEAVLGVYQIDPNILAMYEPINFVDARLAYEVVRVANETDKCVLIPVWEFAADSGVVFQVDAVSGVPFDGIVEHSFTLAQWEGAQPLYE